MTRAEVKQTLIDFCNGVSLAEIDRIYEILKFQNQMGLIDAWVLADFADFYLDKMKHAGTGEIADTADKPVKKTTGAKPIKKSEFDLKENSKLRDEISDKTRQLAADPAKFKKVKKIFKENGATGTKDIPDDKLLIVNQTLDALINEPTKAETEKKNRILDDFDVIEVKEDK